MNHLSEQEKHALALFKERVEAELADKVDSLHLFGSKARGDATEDSDVDVLVVADVTNLEEDRIIDVATEIMLATDVDISPKVYHRDRLAQMRERRSMFWQSIAPDLIQL